MRILRHDQGEREAGLFAAGQGPDPRRLLVLGQADGPEAGANPLGWLLRQSPLQVVDGGVGRIEFVGVVLGDIPDPQARGAVDLAALRRQFPGDQAGQGGLAVAVGA